MKVNVFFDNLAVSICVAVSMLTLLSAIIWFCFSLTLLFDKTAMAFGEGVTFFGTVLIFLFITIWAILRIYKKRFGVEE